MGYVDNSLLAPPKTKPTPDKPEEIIPNPDYETWFQKDQTLLYRLLSSLSKEFFSYVIGMTSSHEVWNALAGTFSSISHNKQLKCNIKLQELKNK